MIGIHDPLIEGEEEREVLEALRSNWLSGGGTKTAAFEEALGDFLGLGSMPVSTVNGTSALHLAVRALGLAPGDAVLVSSYGFVATANCVLLAGAEPVFIGPASAEFPVVTKEQVAAFLEEHVDASGRLRRNGKPLRGMLYNEPYGFACPRLREIASLLEARGMFLVEDASQALGVKVGGKLAGTVGTIGVFSFNGNKTITTGAGGLFVSHDEKLLARARKLRHQSRSDSFDFYYDESGHNFLLSNVLGAVGLAQTKKLPSILDRKAALRSAYRRLLEGGELRLAGAEMGDFPAWLNVVLFPRPVPGRKELAQLAARMEKEGIQVRPGFPSVTSYPMFREHQHHHAGAGEEFFSRSLCLPSGPAVNERQATEIVRGLLKYSRELALL